MEKNRQTKIVAIIALIIGVLALTLGFATFSAQLIIKSKATVTPDDNAFKVVLSKEQNTEVVGEIAPTGDGEEATISNTGSSTISNLKANFVNPGEKVVYEFYAVNLGEYDAYLNKIEYKNITSQATNKVCTTSEGTTDSYVQSACNSIRVTVKVGEDDKACQTSTYGAHKLDKKTGENVTVTIEYDSTGARTDGPFTVEFGDINLNYSTTDTEEKNVPVCTDFNTAEAATGPFYTRGRQNIKDLDDNGRLSTSDKITLGTESFYVVSTDEGEGTVTMLSEWNLNVGNNTVSGDSGIQNSACKGWINNDSNSYCTLAFSSTDYWSSSVSSYPEWVYNEQSNLYSHVENYVNKLKELGYSTITGRLIKHEELVSLGCQADGLGNECHNSPAWIKNTTFWTGSVRESTRVWQVYTDGSFNADGDFSRDSRYGVRPVITINASEI